MRATLACDRFEQGSGAYEALRLFIREVNSFCKAGKELSLLGCHLDTNAHLSKTLPIGHALLPQADPCLWKFLMLFAVWGKALVGQKVIRGMDTSHIPQGRGTINISVWVLAKATCKINADIRQVILKHSRGRALMLFRGTFFNGALILLHRGYLACHIGDKILIRELPRLYRFNR
ncbi:hypothetical protein [Streptomyces graminilatus]|uniref:hypothetical protein n=1 Tax=Streptomyces graminilatus TaxID=1464070 RepID=UPI0012FF2BDA|nr:hypothetical protein [Streptomyces graminilatus]